MAYFVLSPNGEETLNKLLSADSDHLRGGPSHVILLLVQKNQVNRINSF